MTEIHERSINEGDFATVLCEDLVLDGRLHCECPILLNCRFEGTLIGTSKVVIYRDAFFRGTIQARSIRVTGRVEGDLYATEMVELESTASVLGNITAPTIVMENGSAFEGQSHVLRNGKQLFPAIAQHPSFKNELTALPQNGPTDPQLLETGELLEEGEVLEGKALRLNGGQDGGRKEQQSAVKKS